MTEKKETKNNIVKKIVKKITAAKEKKTTKSTDEIKPKKRVFKKTENPVELKVAPAVAEIHPSVPLEEKGIIPEPVLSPVAEIKNEVIKKIIVDKTARTSYRGTGRRKTSVARVCLYPGKGKFIINGLAAQEYFRHKRLEVLLNEPYSVTQTIEKFDTLVSVAGGGLMSQADAVKHGISRALVCYDESLRSKLRSAGLLTRDPRMVERKKYGQPGARKRFQFSKR